MTCLNLHLMNLKPWYEAAGDWQNLHNTELEAKNVTTEYEDKFRTEGKKINYCKVQTAPVQL